MTYSTVSVTVIDEDPTLADAWSTALLCLGVKEDRAVAERNDLAALFIKESSGQLSETTTVVWKALNRVDVD